SFIVVSYVITTVNSTFLGLVLLLRAILNVIFPSAKAFSEEKLTQSALLFTRQGKFDSTLIVNSPPSLLTTIASVSNENAGSCGVKLPKSSTFEQEKQTPSSNTKSMPVH